jgi:hypothetical protein
MSFTVNEFEDLITIINQQPEWRGRLLKALFPDLNIAKAMQDLADNVVILRQMLQDMEARMTHVEQDVNVLKQDVSEIKRDVSNLKGSSLERQYRDTATGLFGLFVKSGRDVTNQVADQLYSALEAGAISENELTQVLAADLLWGGEDRKSKEPIILVMEASWLAEKQDIERAATRSAILRRIGVNAIGIAGGKEWTSEARELAEQLHVAMATNGKVDRSSWDNAMQSS